MNVRTRNEKLTTGHLYPLSELDDYTVEDKELDVRGWDVSGGDGKQLGKVEELIVDPAAMKVRYLVVDVDKDVTRLGGEHFILIPVGVAELMENHDVILVKNLNVNNLHDYPVYDRSGTAIIRQYERNVRNFYLNESSAEDDLDFYAHDHFNDSRFHRHRR